MNEMFSYKNINKHKKLENLKNEYLKIFLINME